MDWVFSPVAGVGLVVLVLTAVSVGWAFGHRARIKARLPVNTQRSGLYGQPQWVRAPEIDATGRATVPADVETDVLYVRQVGPT